MPKPARKSSESVVSPASQMAFAVAICAFAAAGIGLIVNQFLTGWMAVGGMFGVGLFYVGIGIVNLNLRHERPDEPIATESLSHKGAAADNLVGEPVSRPKLFVASESEATNKPGM